MEAELLNVTERRLFASLSSSDLVLSSDEAELVLEKLPHSADAVGRVGRLVQSYGNNRMSREIAQLREAENSFSDELQEYNEKERELLIVIRENEAAQADLSELRDREAEARKALDEAQRSVAKARDQVAATTSAQTRAEKVVRRHSLEMDKVTSCLFKRQEMVRSDLQKRVRSAHVSGFENSTSADLSEEDVEALKAEEDKLRSESETINAMAARLQSRADKLRMRAQALENHRKSGPIDE